MADGAPPAKKDFVVSCNETDTEWPGGWPYT